MKLFKLFQTKTSSDTLHLKSSKSAQERFGYLQECLWRASQSKKISGLGRKRCFDFHELLDYITIENKRFFFSVSYTFALDSDKSTSRVQIIKDSLYFLRTQHTSELDNPADAKTSKARVRISLITFNIIKEFLNKPQLDRAAVKRFATMLSNKTSTKVMQSFVAGL